jgi:hypothetical protein
MMPKDEIFVIKIYLRLFKWFLKAFEYWVFVIGFMCGLLLFLSILYVSDLTVESPDMENYIGYSGYAAIAAFFIKNFVEYIYKTILNREFIFSLGKTIKYVFFSFTALFIISVFAAIVRNGINSFLWGLVGFYVIGIVSMMIWFGVGQFGKKIQSLVKDNDIYKTKEELEQEKILKNN